MGHYSCSVKYRNTILNSAMYTMSQKNATEVAHYNFNAHKPILEILGRDVADKSMLSTTEFVIPPVLTMSLHYLRKHEPPKIVSFQSCWVFAETTHVIGSK